MRTIFNGKFRTRRQRERAVARKSRHAPGANFLQCSWERGKQRVDGSVVAKRFADVRKAVDIARAEDKAPSKLKRILPRFVLAMAGRPGAGSRGGVVAAKQMQQVRGFQSGGSISQPLLVDQQRKRDPRFLAEKSRVLTVPQSDGGQPGSLFLECFLVLAQLRDVFTAENSAVVPQKNQHCWTARPQGPENDFPSIAIRKSDLRQRGAKRLFHDVSILSSASLAVKPRGQRVVGQFPIIRRHIKGC
jgi:hypothetical protein